VDARASDIHIEPAASRLVVRLRIDGAMQEIEAPPLRLRDAIVSRIKIMARLNIAERRLPQDGRMSASVRGTEIDFRVSTLPTVHGESVVIRVLDRDQVALDFSALGFDDQALTELNRILALPFGILLVTGPTGSGKTTTLYAALKTLNTPDRKLMTIEDPVEYQLDGVNQVQVQPQIGLTFAWALRSFLRQNPNIVMVGEIRDLETAQVAVQVALTGHMILSTLHTNDAASGVTRLLDMGVEDYLIVSTVNAILAQRLVRTLCPDCREPYDLSIDLAARLGLTLDAPAPFFRAQGCPACNATGYRGRTTILEILPMTDTIRRLVLDHAAATTIRDAAIAAGMRTMLAHGLTKARAGITTIEEVLGATRSA
jgi:general secretion pathway protein E